jgi:FtsP/CotA-like multicopper oxidase with cupredoxin domain
LTAGGRVDVEVTAPAPVQLGGSGSLVLASGAPARAQPSKQLDLLSYGRPVALPFDPDKANRRFQYSIGRRPGFVDGRPGMWWSINGHLFPDVPMFVVQDGDVVRMHIKNSSRAVHPMHLHGHHAVVLARDGVTATGSPWWVDSLDVASGHSYDIAFVADNPGIWMDHCHNLPHASQGLVAHLMYAGVTEPYRVGGAAGNQPE